MMVDAYLRVDGLIMGREGVGGKSKSKSKSGKKEL